MQLRKNIEHQPYRFGFAGANARARAPAMPSSRSANSLLGLFHQQGDLLGALAQAHAIAREHT